jgi:HEAT repeat protein
MNEDREKSRKDWAQKDQRPSNVLLEDACTALLAGDEYRGYELIGIVQARGTEDEFLLAEKYCQSTTTVQRSVGAAVLGQLGFGLEAQREKSVQVLIGLLSDPEEKIIEDAISALGHWRDSRAVPYLVAFKNHSNEDIRFSVAFALASKDEENAVAALCELSRDSDRDVRNYATWALGSMTELDTEAIREVFLARVVEEDDEIRGEALVGLARVRHPLALELVVAELQRDNINIYPLDAAVLLGDPRLFPLLSAHLDSCDGTTDECFLLVLNEALEACKPGTSQ